MKYKHHVVQSPFGWIGLLGSDKGLRRLSLRPEFQEALGGLGPELDESDNEPHGFDAEAAWLERFFRGEGDSCEDIALDLSDSPPFFAAAWQACRRIPPGGNQDLRLAGRSSGQPGCGAGGRTGHGPEPAGARNPVPPRHRRRRKPGWIQRGRRRAQGRAS